jgi:hypothetical protein
VYSKSCFVIACFLVYTTFSVGCIDETPAVDNGITLSPTIDINKFREPVVKTTINIEKKPATITTIVQPGSSETPPPFQSGHPSSVQILITYYGAGAWSGAYYNDGTPVSVKGTGSAIFTVNNPGSNVSTSIQKRDGTTEKLKVEILKNGNEVTAGSTSAAYGVIEISATV